MDNQNHYTDFSNMVELTKLNIQKLLIFGVFGPLYMYVVFILHFFKLYRA